jgi:hypothetical protein
MSDEKIGDKISKGIKKGKPTWKPASITDVVNKEPGYRYRWVNKLPDNLYKKEQEGWETVSGLTGDRASAVDDGRVHTGKNLTSAYEKHDVILQRMPEDLAEARDAYVNEKTRKRTLGLTAHVKKEMRDKGGNAPVHGNITIGSLKGTTVID